MKRSRYGDINYPKVNVTSGIIIVAFYVE